MKTKSLFLSFIAFFALIFTSCQDHIELEGNIFVGEIDEHPYAVFLESLDTSEEGVTWFNGHYLD